MAGRPLRVAYVSSDFCQHTVGLFVKDVLKTHDPARVTVFAYSAGQVKDWVTVAIRGACRFRDVAAFTRALEDTLLALAQKIAAGTLDALVKSPPDGHTGESRIGVWDRRRYPELPKNTGFPRIRSGQA